MTETKFLLGVPADHVLQRLKLAGGKEVESGKFASPESSAALAVNTFGWFVKRPETTPPVPGLDFVDWPAKSVEVEYCARFPWAGGRHPWLDAAITTPQWLIGVESKRFEPFRDAKRASLSEAYDRDCWGENMARFCAMRDRLRATPSTFKYLDVAQLVKHAYGLVTDAKRMSRRPALLYLFAEPAMRGTVPITTEAHRAHRSEIDTFTRAIDGDEVRFAACSYRDWLATWRSSGGLAEHRAALLKTFAP